MSPQREFHIVIAMEGEEGRKCEIRERCKARVLLGDDL